MFDIMNRLSAEFGGFESLAYYLKFLSFIAPKVLDLLFGVTPKGKATQERKKFLYSNFPVPSKVGLITYVHFLFSLLTPVRFGILDGQHRFSALLSIFTGFDVTIPDTISVEDLPPVFWQRKDGFLESHKPFKKEGLILEGVLSRVPAQNVVLLVPLSTYEGNFESLRDDCFMWSLQRDQFQQKYVGTEFCSLFVTIAATIKDRQNTFSKCCLSNPHDVTFEFTGTGLVSVQCRSRYRGADVCSPTLWMDAIEGLKATALQLAQFDLVAIVTDVKAFATFENYEIGPRLLLIWDTEYNSEEFGPMKDAYTAGFDSNNKIDVEEAHSVAKIVPLYLEDEPCVTNLATWSFQKNLLRDWMKSGTISVPGLLAIHDTWLFLSKVIRSDVYRAYLLTWLTSFINDKRADNSHDSEGFVDKMKKKLRLASPEKRLDIISSLIFFPGVKKKWLAYFLERFNTALPFPMLLPKVVLGFGRLVGFIAHSSGAVLELQSLLISSMRGSEWSSVNNKERHLIVNLNDDVRMVSLYSIVFLFLCIFLPLHEFE